MQSKFVLYARKRKDKWGDEVLSRLQTCIDLIAVGARYHNKCVTAFKRVKEGGEEGCSGLKNKNEAFVRFCDWFETECDTKMSSVQDLYAKMQYLSPVNVIYSKKTFRDKLKHRYEDDVYFVPANGNKSEAVCFKNFSNFVLENFQRRPQSKHSIINAAARIIRDDILKIETSMESYPTSEEIKAAEHKNPWIPESLTWLMKHLISSEIKRTSLIQCLVQSVRPRSVIAPIPFSVGVSVDKSFGSKWLVNFL